MEKLSDDFANFCNYTIESPKARNIWCAQHSMNSLCIGPYGEFYKCEHYFGQKDHVIGDVKFGLNYSNDFLTFMDVPFGEKCQECVIFPICLGGCPQRRLKTSENSFCEFTLDHLIKQNQVKLKQLIKRR